MRYADIKHNIFEKITEGLAGEATKLMMKEIKEWVNTKAYSEFLSALDLTDAVEDMHVESSLAYEGNDQKAMDRASDTRDKILSKIEQTLYHDESIREPLIASLVEQMETILQKLTVDYVEKNFGKIEPFVRGNDYETESKKHLYWLQHILVHIKLDGKFPSGKPKTGGGFFTRFPDKKDFENHAYSKQNLKWDGNDLPVGIVVLADTNELWSAYVNLIVQRYHIDEYGESMVEGNPLRKVLPSIISTYVHEVGHLEQEIKKKSKGWSRSSGITLLKNNKKREPVASMKRDDPRGSPNKYGNDTRTYKKFRPGLKGNPDHLSGIDNVEAHSDEYVARMTEYYGTRHEIDAHAASTASTIVSEYMLDNERDGRYPEQRQRELNSQIESIIYHISKGYGVGVSCHSYDAYVTYVRDKIKNADKVLKAGRYPLQKVDTLHRKVWRLYMLKLVKHLMAYIKPVTSEYDHEDGNPRQSKTGNVRLGQRPALP
jgi:hypothetical protein